MSEGMDYSGTDWNWSGSTNGQSGTAGERWAGGSEEMKIGDFKPTRAVVKDNKLYSKGGFEAKATNEDGTLTHVWCFRDDRGEVVYGASLTGEAGGLTDVQMSKIGKIAHRLLGK